MDRLDKRSDMGTDFLGHAISLSIKAGCLGPESRKLQGEWNIFQHDFLTSVCAARNTPSLVGSSLQQEWWRLTISLKGAMDDFDYIHEFCDRMDDALKNLLPAESTFSEVYQLLWDKPNIVLDVSSSSEHCATKDYKTKLSTNKGLIESLGMDSICYHLYRKGDTTAPIIPRPTELRKSLSVGDKLSVSEDARLQFKRLQIGVSMNQKKAQGEEIKFNPQNGQDYVEWIWDCCPRGLGEYISAFTKNDRGGAIYYGMKEESDRSGYIAEGLCLDMEMRNEIKRGICEKVRHKMLWIKRDLSSDDGYKQLAPEDINCQEDSGQVAVDFIELSEKKESQQGKKNATTSKKTQGPQGSRGANNTTGALKGASRKPDVARATETTSSKYLLEVRVAPFNGIVFYDPQGPEAYTMEEERGKFEPVRMTEDKWLARMRDHGWCSRHKSTKGKECSKCLSEQN